MIDSNNIEIMRENIRDLMIDDLSSRRSIEEIKDNLGDPSEAESVEGESAFSKISTINNKIDELIKTADTTITTSDSGNASMNISSTRKVLGVHCESAYLVHLWATGGTYYVTVTDRDFNKVKNTSIRLVYYYL